MSSNPPSGACARQRGLHHQANERLHGLRGRRRRELRGQPRAGRRRLAAAVATALATVLATLPTASAFASAGPSLPNGGAGTAKRSGLAVGRLALPGELLSTGQLQSLLAALPLSDLSAKQLARYLAGLEGIGVLTKLETGLLSGKQLGAVGLEESLREAIEKLGAGAGAGAKLGELANAEDLQPLLEAALEGKLGGLLDVLLGGLPGGSVANLERALDSLSLEQLVGALLKATTPKEQLAGELAQLTGGVFGELGAENKLEGLLGGSELTGGFAPKSVGEVSEELKTTPQGVSEELGQTSAQLPESATVLTAPLANGKLAGVAPAAVKGLLTGLLSGAEGEEKGGKGTGGEGSGETGGRGSEEGGGKGSEEGGGKGSGEGGGKGSGESKNNGTGEGKGTGGGGGQGGPGGSGAGGSSGTTTVVLTIPGVSPAAEHASATKATGRKPPGVAIVGLRVHGGAAIVALRVPAAGAVVLTGKGLSTTGRRAGRAERLTLRVALSRAGAASLRHRHRLAVRLRASFVPTTGKRSSTTITVVFG